MIIKIKSVSEFEIRTSNGMLKVEDDYKEGFRILLNGNEIFKKVYGEKFKHQNQPTENEMAISCPRCNSQRIDIKKEVCGECGYRPK